jgi:hypothetical protein
VVEGTEYQPETVDVIHLEEAPPGFVAHSQAQGPYSSFEYSATLLAEPVCRSQPCYG